MCCTVSLPGFSCTSSDRCCTSPTTHRVTYLLGQVLTSLGDECGGRAGSEEVGAAGIMILLSVWEGCVRPHGQ